MRIESRIDHGPSGPNRILTRKAHRRQPWHRSAAYRGMPLVELSTAAVKANDYVTWNESTF